MRIYLIRHGKTNRNDHPELIGQSPEEPLNELGKEQAKLLGERFKKENIKFDEVYCSPYIRALDTCKIVTSLLDNQITIDERLREYGTGMATDKVRHEIINEDIFNRMMELGMHFAWEGGESLFDVEKRASLWLYDTLQKHKDTSNNIAVFSHGMVIKTLLHYIMQFDHHLSWRIDIKNTAISTLDYKLDHWFPKTINDTAHLK